MSETALRQVLVHVDADDRRGRSALAWAAALAAAQGAALEVMDVITPLPSRISRMLHRDSEVALAEARGEQLTAFCQTELAESGVRWGVQVAIGVPFMQVIRRAMRGDVDLVVRSAEGRGAGRLFGSTDMNLLRKCPSPLLVVRAGRRLPRRLLAALHPDADDPVRNSLNPKIMTMAGRLTAAFGATLDVVHAWDVVGEQWLRGGAGQVSREQWRELVRRERQYRFDALAAEIKPYGLDIDDPRVHVLKGRPEKVVPEVVDELGIDLVLMGTVGRTGLPGFLMGNTAEAVLSSVDASVLALKPDGFETTVTPDD